MNVDRAQLDEINEAISRLTVRAASHLALIYRPRQSRCDSGA